MQYGTSSVETRPSHRGLKRIIDVVLSLIVMVLILWWLTPILALLIVLESRGPVFFAQKRTGKNNCTFVCYKFRTMRVNGDANRIQAARNDERITRLGHFLRETNLDELPQFWNVLKGDMSVIGPRPHMLRHTVRYAQHMSNYADRHAVRPGITGLAQVRGYIGAINTREDLVNRVESDLEYIATWSFGLDFSIFVATVLGRFKGLPGRLNARLQQPAAPSRPALQEPAVEKKPMDVVPEDAGTSAA